MLNKLLNYTAKRPQMYEPSTKKFWDDEHISKGMLEAHLDPQWDAASRKHKFISDSVDWIASIADPVRYPNLLDLGCGPGLYAERFCKRGYHVTGIDFSKRSIEYAINNAKIKDITIDYKYQNYLDIAYQEEFDVITLIYCDFGVLSDHDRAKLLKSIYRALKPNGKLILDVFTPNHAKDRKESRNWYYSENDFWSDESHVCLESFYRYDDQSTILKQTVIITEENVECYNIWDHTFTKEELAADMRNAGFSTVDFYGNVAGDTYQADGSEMCVVAVK